MTVVLQRDSGPSYKIEIPLATVAVADHYAGEIGLANTEHLLLRLLYDKLLMDVILPRAEYDSQVKDQIAVLEAELADKKNALDAARIAPLLPIMLVDGQPRTLAQLRAANAAMTGGPAVMPPQQEVQPEIQTHSESIPQPEANDVP